MFNHPAWAVGSYSSGPPAAGTAGTKWTGGFYQADVSPGMYNSVPSIKDAPGDLSRGIVHGDELIDVLDVRLIDGEREEGDETPGVEGHHDNHEQPPKGEDDS